MKKSTIAMTTVSILSAGYLAGALAQQFLSGDSLAEVAAVLLASVVAFRVFRKEA